MAPYKIFAIVVIITESINVVNCSTLYDMNMVRDFNNHFKTNWIIIQTCKKTDYQIIKLANNVKDTIIGFINIFEWEDFFSAADFRNVSNLRPLVLLTCWSCPQDCFLPINKMPYLMMKFTWLLLRQENSPLNLQSINLPINSMFMIIEEQNPNFYTINEVYGLNENELLFVEYGTWSSQHGLNCTLISLEERRSDLHGQNLTTLMEPENSANPMMIMYVLFCPTFYAISNRLNLTIDMKTNPEDHHEMSVLMNWADNLPVDKALLPIYASRQSIYFKDIGLGIQLDGYITPFETMVWLALIFLAVTAGILAYFAADVYVRMTPNKKLPLRIDFYVFKYFYILCQKSEMVEQYAAHRIITLSEWILSIFLISCYSAIFISFISVDIPKPPFTTLDELLMKKDYNIVSSKHFNSNNLLFLKESGDPKLRELYESHYDDEKNAVDAVIDEFCQRRYYIFITSDVHITLIKSSPRYFYCKFSKNRIPLINRYLTWYIDKESQYTRIIKVFLMKAFTAGAIQNYFIQKITFKNIPQSTDFREITMEDTTLIFIIIGAGWLISALIFFLEIVYSKLKTINW